MTRRSRPTIRPERDWSRQQGGCLVAGIDEAGRGPLAGPVVAAAVVFDLDGRRPVGLADSKKLTHAARERLFPRIQRQALAWGIGLAHPHEIDLINILQATRLAAVRALGDLATRLPDGQRVGALVTDALDLPAAGLPTMPIIKGDSHSASIAAASILAKVTRDRLMDRFHEEFPVYGWDKNRGYPTADHYAALERHGPSSIHRMSFSGVGFFDEQPRPSASFERLARLCEVSPGTRDAVLSLWEEVERVADILPPGEVSELRGRVSERAAGVGVALEAVGD